jgi:hypothetical protein
MLAYAVQAVHGTQNQVAHAIVRSSRHDCVAAVAGSVSIDVHNRRHFPAVTAVMNAQAQHGAGCTRRSCVGEESIAHVIHQPWVTNKQQEARGWLLAMSKS